MVPVRASAEGVVGVPGIGFVEHAGGDGWESLDEGAACGEKDGGKAGVYVVDVK